MKYIKKFNGALINENLTSDRQKDIDTIISYIEGNTNQELYEYFEIFNVKKGSNYMFGKLYISLFSNKALRFNWIQNDLVNRIKSIDIWLNFKFEDKPNYTLEMNNIKVVDYLSDFLQFYNNPESLVLTKVTTLSEDIDLDNLDKENDLSSKLKDYEDKLKRARKPEKKAEYQKIVDGIRAYVAVDEISTIDSQKISMLDKELKIDVFKSIELYTIQVARGRSNSLIITGQAGVGKCHGKGTKIMMFDGTIKNVEDIIEGDLLMGDDSTPRTVLSLARGMDNIYKIKPVKGDEFTCNSEHILSLRHSTSGDILNIPLNEFLSKSSYFKKQYKLYKVPINFPDKEILVDPYFIGLWIGDGGRNRGVSITTADDEIVTYLNDMSNTYNLFLRKYEQKDNKSSVYSISTGRGYRSDIIGRNRNALLSLLNSYGMINVDEKFIPSEYLFNSYDVRIKVLAGLIDSDGYYNKNSNCYEIATKCKNLSNQIIFLCRSLGYSVSSRIKYNKQYDRNYYIMNISGSFEDLPVLLDRKKGRKRKQIKNVLNTGFEVEKIAYDEYYGFELDGNHLYLLGDFTVTHNTATVTDTLSSIGYVKDYDYYKATGTVTTAGLYEVLFKNRNMLTVFDDCDAVFKDPDSVNYLKGALDTYDKREISKLNRSNTFDATGMSDEEIQAEYDATDGKKLPNRFTFNGKIIFISNLPDDKFDDALISRSLHVDVHLNRQDVINRMAELMKKIAPDVDVDKKQEALDYLNYITEQYPVKFDLNIRTLIHAINLRANNDGTMKIGDKEEEIWKLLLKKYLIKVK